MSVDLVPFAEAGSLLDLAVINRVREDSGSRLGLGIRAVYRESLRCVWFNLYFLHLSHALNSL